MKVMCIERSSFTFITNGVNSGYLTNSDSFTIEPGQWLEVYDGSKDYVYYTFEMNGKEWFIERNKFITVQQFRQKQLNKIL